MHNELRKKTKYKGVTTVKDRHGKLRYRLRTTVKGRKISGYINEEKGSAEFDRRYMELMNGGRNTQTKKKKGTFSHLITTYTSSPGFNSLAERTRENKQAGFAWINKHLGTAPYDKTTPGEVEQLMSLRNGDTAANYLRSLMIQLFDHAAKWHGFKERNPARLAETITIRSDGIPTWTGADRAKYRAVHPSGTMARLAFELLYGTAAARSDVVAMSRANLTGGSLSYARQKTGVRATVPVTVELQRELDQLPRDQFMLLQNSRGKAFKVAAFAKAFRAWCDRAGLVGLSPHGLRKARACSLAEAGATQESLAAFLGHATPQEVSTYTRAASREILAANAADCENKNRSNVVQPLSGWTRPSHK